MINRHPHALPSHQLASHQLGNPLISRIFYLNMQCSWDCPMACSHGLDKMAVYGKKASIIIKFTLTTLSPVCTSNQIIPFRIVVFPSNPINETSYWSKYSSLSPRPLNKSGYVIYAPLPWLTVTLLTSNPAICKVTIKASSCGYGHWTPPWPRYGHP